MKNNYYAHKGENVGIVFEGDSIYVVPRYLISKKGRFILPTSFLKHLLKPKQESTANTLTVAYHPGFACNLSCSYCYQENEKFKKPSIKRKYNDESIASFISNYSNRKGYKNIDITYIGGETMLYMNDIVEFHKKLSSQDFHISSSFITNATILNEDIISSMRQLCCKSVQITLDGNRESHNTYRFYKNSKGTFDDVIKNIKILYSSLESEILVRINVTGQNIDSLIDLLDCLNHDLDIKKFSIYFSLIDDTLNFQDSRGDIYEFLEKYRGLYRIAILKGFNAVLPSHSGNCLTCRYPQNPNAVDNDGIVITADGALYSCWDSAGQKNKEVGNVREGYLPELIKSNWVKCGYNSSDKHIQEEARKLALIEILDKRGSNENS